MSYNGSGTFNINTAGQPVVTGTVISSTAFNALTADLGTGLSTAITKDGQTVATAVIPFAAGMSSTTGSFSTGIAVGGATAQAGGIAFPATAVAVADVNTLDDYEEGMWTPGPTFGGNSTGMTGTFAGTYTKIGRQVTLFYGLTFTAKGSSTGNLLISGLPFTVSGVGTAPVAYHYHMATAGTFECRASATNITMGYGGTAVDVTALTQADINNDTVIYGGAVYFV